ncbi:DUF4397 domain-containing protein [Sphingobacterium deserti]|uniref:DUF4397 domain-containing protein n=1 Tax=Sphingobacterium deserti TaxID=1229276 RepID=A0A0B8SZW4_9SPHI|nr:DUF4397 domain-containing protein [Sphingobacterium deserti]KGE13577.1 hypothetical protein DI53_2638 [Sphingobacterium deserti]
MKTISLQSLICLFFSLFIFSSCLKDNDGYYDGPATPAAYMTFINAYPENDFLSFDLHAQNSPFPLQYKSYLRPAWGVFTGERKLTITAPSGNSPLIDTVLNIRDSSAYSTFIYGTATNPRFAMTQDRTIQNLGENTGIRFFNLANIEGNVNLVVGNADTAAFANRPMETGASAVQHQLFQPTASGSINLRVMDASGNEIARRDNYTLRKGYYYSIFLTGNASGGNSPLYLGVVYH